MEKNTVLLSLEDYNELREFREEVKKGKTVVLSHYRCDVGTEYITTVEAIDKLAEQNSGLIEDIKSYRDEIYELKNPEPKVEMAKEELEKVGKMSIWRFIKWIRNG